MTDITVRLLEDPADDELRQILGLMAQADFADLDDGFQWLRDAVNGSVAAIIAVDQSNKIVGFARALGDGVSDCYIQDVVVDAACRNMGIGRKLVEFLKDELLKRNIDWIGLIATPGNAEFYRKLGFEELEQYTPMCLKKSSR